MLNKPASRGFSLFEIDDIFERNFCPHSRITRNYRRAIVLRDLTRSAASGHAVGINSAIGDVPSSTVIGGPKRVCDRIDDEGEGFSLLSTTKRFLYDVTFLHSLACRCSIDRNFRRWLTKEERESLDTHVYTYTYVHTHTCTCYMCIIEQRKDREGDSAGAD